MKKIVFKILKNSHFAKFTKFRMKKIFLLYTHFFFLGKLFQINNFFFCFALHFHYTGDTPYRVWLDLDNSLTRWNRPFLKFLFRKVQKIPFEILTILLGKL